MEPKNNQIVILFDGVCGLCNKSVSWIISKDRTNQFRYSSLQGEYTIGLKTKSEEFPTSDSLILIMDGQIFDKSTAALLITKKLPIPWKLLYAFIIIPKSLRDVVYDYIATNRYKWFGKSDTCKTPNYTENHLFID